MNKISEFRKAANLTQSEFSKLLNVSQGALGHYEVGRRTPRLKIAQRIIYVLNQHGANCSFSDVFPVEN